MAANANILVVDDEAEIRDMLTELLGRAGYAVRATDHGQAALRELEVWAPDLILLDLGMPVMDGWQFLAAYDQCGGQRAPVVVCAATTQPAQRVLAAGAAAFIPKPFALKRLLQTVSEQLTASPPTDGPCR